MALVCHSWTDPLSGPAARMRWWERRRRNRSARRCRASFGPEGGAVRRRDWRGDFGQHQWRWESSPLHLPGSQVLLSGARLRWRLEPLPRQHRTRVSTRSLSPFNAHAAINWQESCSLIERLNTSCLHRCQCHSWCGVPGWGGPVGDRPGLLFFISERGW